MGKRWIVLMLVGLLGLGLTLVGCEQEDEAEPAPPEGTGMEEGGEDMPEGTAEKPAGEEEDAPEGTGY